MGFSVFIVLSIFALAVICYKIASRETSLASRHFSWFSLFATFLVTQVSTCSLLYTAELAYYDGVFAILYPLGTSIGLLALGLGIGTKLHKLQFTDISDVFYTHYGSEWLKKASSLLLFVALLGLLIAQAMALKSLLKTIGIDQELFFIVIWMSIIFLALQRMQQTTARTDIFQAGLIIAVFSTAYFLSHSPSSSTLLLSEVRDNVAQDIDSKLTSYLLMPCFFVFFEPKTIRNISFKISKSKTLTASLFSGLILFLISLVPAYCGMAGKAIEAELTCGDIAPTSAVENTMLIKCCTYILLFALMCGILSLFRSLSARIKASDPIFGTGVWTLATGLVAFACSHIECRIPDLVFTSYELVVVCLFVPLVMAALSERATAISNLGAMLSMIFGATSFCLCHLFAVTFFPEMLSLAISWLGFIVGQRIAKRQEAHDYIHS
ncbi:MAG: hypothetical protein JSR46_00810 [Verrucomicrobia bacterium]|nr:hypothetical protein [Verrucomicrobiota bacterium]